MKLESKKYAGNPFTSLNTFTIIGTSALMAYLLTRAQSLQLDYFLLIPLGFIFLLFIIFGMQMHYFVIEQGMLLVRNHYFPWKKVSFFLQDLQNIALETPHKQSTGLRIITNKYQSKFYGAGSLREKHWDELKSDLTSIGIPVRGELDGII